MRPVFVLSALLTLAACATGPAGTPREVAEHICRYEPAAYAFILAIDTQAHLDPALMLKVRAAHLIISSPDGVSGICHPLPTDIASILVKLQDAWNIIVGAQSTAQQAIH